MSFAKLLMEDLYSSYINITESGDSILYLGFKSILLPDDHPVLKENRELSERVVSLDSDKSELSGKVASLDSDNAELSGKLAQLDSDIEKLSDKVESLESDNASLSGKFK